MKVFTSDMMRKLENQAINENLSLYNMMENAGAKVVSFLKEKYDLQKKRIVILAGKGNNAGDGFVCARLLKDLCAEITVILVQAKPKAELSKIAFSKIQKDAVIISSLKEGREKIKHADIIIDAIFGFGFKGLVPCDIKEFIIQIGISKADVISLDLPSGADADSGKIGGVCVAAKYTLAFSALKVAHLVYPAKEFCGETIILDIGIDKDKVDSFPAILYFNENIVQKKRNPQSHKGDYGTLLCVCGSYTMPGAAIMAVRAALRSGTGLVNLAVSEKTYPLVASSVPESIFTLYEKGKFSDLEKSLEKASAILIGCGLSKSDLALEALKVVLENAKAPVIIDADGINLLSEHIDLLNKKKAPVIITPPPKEMARLMQKSVAEIQNDRLKIAKEAAEKWDITVVLKANATVVANKDKLFLNTTGNAGMAKGGSGDVLAGMISAFVAQKLDLFTSCTNGVYLHGLAGDLCAKKLSQTAMLPTDIIDELPRVFLETER